MQSLESQFYAFIVTVLIGIIMGICYDFYRVTKGIIHPRKFFVYLGDLLFWVVSTLIVFFMLLIGNWGEFRFYVLVGALVGALLYYKILSHFVIDLLVNSFSFIRKTINLVFRAIKFTWFLITYPLFILKNIIIIPVGLLGRAWSGITTFTGRHIERLITGPVKRQVRSVKTSVKQKLRSLFVKKD